jgi:geranylgeranyl diphosphate synthase, type II
MYSLSEIESIVRKSVLSIDLKGEPKELYQPIEYIISIGGKRIRPSLCLLTYSLFSNEMDNRIIYPAMALEIFHAFTLIHDDIMDNADMRRGQLTIHKKWNKNIAILSGDVMSIKAYEYLSYSPADKISEVLSVFTKTAKQVCEGQQYDMNFENEKIITIDDYLEMIGLKTAVLLACSAKIGAIIGGADNNTAQALYDYGYNLGIAFQITDDYLDVYADPSTFGKNVGGDIVNNKKSWLLVKSLKEATGADERELREAMMMGEESACEKIDRVKRLYEKLNINNSTEEEIDQYFKSALNSIENLNLSYEKMALLNDFALSVTKRTK